MKQILGVTDTNTDLNFSTFDIPKYSLSPAPSPSRTTMKSSPLRQSRPMSAGIAPTTGKKPPSGLRTSRGGKGTMALTTQKAAQRSLTASSSFASLLDTSLMNVSAMPLAFAHTPAAAYSHNGPLMDMKAAQLVYNGHFSGLDSIGASGMTILEELTDLALQVCENGRTAGQKHHSRGAALLTGSGKVYTGCDVYVREGDPNGVSAERAALLAAVADGAAVFHCLVITTDTMKQFPVPDGQSREFMRNFGVFPVILANCDLDMAHTSTQDLYPLNQPPDQQFHAATGGGGGGGVAEGKSIMQSFSMTPGARFSVGMSDPKTPKTASADDVFDPENEDDWDVPKWTEDRVKKWLISRSLTDLVADCADHNIDGRLLLQVDEKFARNTLLISHAMKRRKLVRHVELLKKRQVAELKEKTMDELDEYVMLLETHRIKLVAKLKAVFDRFDRDKEGRLTGIATEQALVYMNRPVDSVQVGWPVWKYRLLPCKHSHPDTPTPSSSWTRCRSAIGSTA